MLCEDWWLVIDPWICLLLLRLMCATSARTWSTHLVSCRTPQPFTLTACFCSALMKSRWRQRLCCYFVSTSRVPWAWPSRWEPPPSQVDIRLPSVTASIHKREPCFSHLFKVTEEVGVVHRSRLQVGFSSFHFHFNSTMRRAHNQAAVGGNGEVLYIC